ncbi:MAG: DUF1995 family protein [Cyanobium sp.]
MSAEAQALEAMGAAISAGGSAGRWTVELRFEGLRILPVALRLLTSLSERGSAPRLLCADMGATALARRDAPDLAPQIASFGGQIRLQAEAPTEGLLLLLGASQAEYNQVEQLCGRHRGPVLLLNPALEDAAVGIGSVARQRRRGFLSQWDTAFALVPAGESALRRAYPAPWELYRLDPEGFRLVATFERRPDGEQQAEALGGEESGLGRNLKALGDLMEGLQN